MLIFEDENEKINYFFRIDALCHICISAIHSKEVRIHIYPSGGHGWGFRNTAQGFRYHAQMLDDLTTWLQHF